MAKTVKSLDTELAVVKNELSQMGQLFSKLEIALDKITDVSNNIGQLLAVHERRLEDGEEEFEEMKAEMAKAEKKFDTDIKELHSRLSTNTRELETKMTKEVDKVLEAIKDLKLHMVEKHTSLEERLNSLERWRWILLGAFAVGGMLLGNGIEFSTFF